MSDARDIAKNSAFVATGDIAGRVLALIITISIARSFGSELYGVFVFAYAFPTFLLLLADWGMGPVFILNVSRDRSVANKYFTNIIFVRVTLSALAYVLVVISAYLFGFPQETFYTIVVIGAASTLISIGEIFFSVCAAFQRMEYFALPKIIERVFTAGLILFLLSSGYGLGPVTYAILLGAFVFVITGYLLVRSKFTRVEGAPEISFLKGLIKEGVPFMMSAVFASVFFSLVIILLTVFKGPSATGYFNAAFSLVIAATVLPGYLGPAIFPIMSKHSRTSKDYVRKVLHKSQKFFFLFGLPMAVGGFVLAGPIIETIYGKEFLLSALVLQILIWDIAFTFYLTGVKHCLASFNLIRLHVMTVGGGALLNLILCFILIPQYSYIGASVAFIVSKFAIVLVLTLVISTRIGPLGISQIVPKPVIASIFMAIVLLLLSGTGVVILIVIGIAVYSSTVVLVRAFNEDDKRILKEAILGKWQKKTA